MSTAAQLTGDPAATILITTKNRRDELRVALRSCFQQSVPVEVLVIDDGSTDGTAEMVRQEFPAARLDRAEQSRGYIVHRNRGARLASAPVVFSIDDDAAFQSPDTVEVTLAEFDHPRVGAVSIPHVDVNKPPVPADAPPDDGQIYCVAHYIGCAHALRTDLFRRLGGYREFLLHQTEEMDYCVRLYDAGYVVRRGRAASIHHYDSPRRDQKRQYVQSARNTLLFAWYNAPMPQLVGHWAANHLNLLRFGLARRHPVWVAEGIAAGWRASAAAWSARAPVRRSTYRLFRRLVKRRIVPLPEVEPLLPPPGLGRPGSG